MFVVWCTEVVSSAFIIFFFFKQKTAYEMRISDWSSDVCSSDLVTMRDGCRIAVDLWLPQPLDGAAAAPERVPTIAILTRSEERRVGKECVSTCRSRWSPYP